MSLSNPSPTRSVISPEGLRSAAALSALFLAQGTASAQASSGSSELLASGDDLLELPKLNIEDTRFKSPTSPKFTQPLRDTPQEIVTVPSTVYVAQGATTLSDVLRNTPGITFAAGEGGNAAATAGDSFYLRGFDTTGNIFVDGVRDVGAYSRDVFNFEEVEIAKGAAATDVGRSASSGYVNLVTKLPRLDAATAATASYGFDEVTSQSQQRVTVDLNQPLDGHSPVAGSAVRLNAMWQDSGTIGRDYAGDKSWGLAPSLALGLGTPTRVFASYEHLRQEDTPDYGLPVPAFPGYTSTPPPPAIDWTTFYGFTADYDHVTADAVTARVEHDFSRDLTVSEQFRYSRVDREAVVTGPGRNATAYDPTTGLLVRTRQGNKRATDILSSQTNATGHASTGSIRHDLSGGLELSREDAYSPTFTRVELAPIPVAQPSPTTPPDATPTRSGAWGQARTDTLALYAFDTLKLSRRWQATGGFRWDHYSTDYLSVADYGTPTRLLASGDLLTWKTGLVFKPVRELSLYVSYGISYKPPGTDLTLSSTANNQNNPDTDPQRTTNAEIGAKREFLHGRLLATFALFETKNNKTVFTDPILGPIPAGAQTIQGSEFDLTGKLTDAWLILGGISWLDSVYDNGTAAQIGTPLPLTPKWSGNVWTTYRLPHGFMIGGGVQYRGAANRLDATTTVPRTMPAFWLLNAMIACDVTPHFSLRLNVNNVTDARYVKSFNNNGARFSPGAPRSYLLTAAVKF